MAVRSKNNAELKVGGAKISNTINERKTSVWIDIESQISKFTIWEFPKSLDTAAIKLQDIESKDQEFRDYGTNPIHLLGTMNPELVSNGWATSASIKLIEGTRPSIKGRDLIAELGLQLVKKAPGFKVLSIQDENAAHDDRLEKWQEYFSKLFSNLLNGW